MSAVDQQPVQFRPDTLHEAGRTAASLLDPVTRHQIYRQWHRTSDHPYSVGFRDYTLTTYSRD